MPPLNPQANASLPARMASTKRESQRDVALVVRGTE